MNADRIRLSVAVIVSILVHGAIGLFAEIPAGRPAITSHALPVALTIASPDSINVQQPAAVTSPPELQQQPPPIESQLVEAVKPPTVTMEPIADDMPSLSESDPEKIPPAPVPVEIEPRAAAAVASTTAKQPLDLSNFVASAENGHSETVERMPIAKKPDITASPLYHLIPKPNYPSRARELGEEGIVIIAVHVGDDGGVLDAYISKSSGFPRLDGSALATVTERWRFKPARLRGKTVPSWVRVPIKFDITGR